MELIKDVKRLLKYGWRIAALKGDATEFRGGNVRFIIFDTGMYADNLGDVIINYYCQQQFDEMGLNIVHRIPTQHKVSEADDAFLAKEIHAGKIITGTNVLCKHIFDSNQWQKPTIDARLSHLILMGVGIDNYKKKMDGFTKKFYRAFLEGSCLHSVRDFATEALLKSIGIENVVNTACPTMWNLTPEFCRKINRYKTDDVITTVTEYSQNPVDFEILDILLKHYNNVYLWLQSEKDLPYIKTYPHFDKLRLVGSSVEEYNKILAKENLEYIGSRLHGGIHALNYGRRSLIIAVDERGEFISKDTGLPVVPRREALDKLETLIISPRETVIELPMENIKSWKKSLVPA